MRSIRADAFVLFGATGDLAQRRVFPALHALVRRWLLDMPIVGIARSPIGIEGLRERVRASLVAQGIFDAGTELIANRAPESDGQTAWGPVAAADLIAGNAGDDGWHDPEPAESNPH